MTRTKVRDVTNLALANGTTRRQAIVGFAMVFGGLTVGSAKAEDEISRTAESIHQEPVFKANRKLADEALTDSKQFDKVIQLSGVVQSMHLGEKPVENSREVGVAFTLFGGYITGHKSNLCWGRESCRPGEPAAGLRASIRLRGSSWWSKALGPRSYLTIRAFLTAKRRSWLRDGKRTIGSRLTNSWGRAPGIAPFLVKAEHHDKPHFRELPRTLTLPG